MNKTRNIAFISGLAVVGGIAIAQSVHAQSSQGFEALTSVPGLFQQGQATDPIKVLRGLYGLAIGAGGVIAVVMIILGGFKYMYEESVFGKSSAKEQIINAFAGLALILGSYIILRTINVDLVNFDLSLPGGTGRVQGLIASQQATDQINAALRDAAAKSTQRLQDIGSLKTSLSSSQAQLETLKKQPKSAERDALIANLENQIQQTNASISQKTIEHVSLTNADILTTAKAKEFDREMEKLNALIKKDESGQASADAQGSLKELSADMERQILILNNNMNTVAELDTTGDLSVSKESLVAKAGQDIAYLSATKGMLDELSEIKTIRLAEVDTRSSAFDQIMGKYSKTVADFKSAGRNDLAVQLQSDIDAATKIVKIKESPYCSQYKNKASSDTPSLCKP